MAKKKKTKFPNCAMCTLLVRGKVHQTKKGKKIYRGHAKCIKGLRKLPTRASKSRRRHARRRGK